VVGLHFFFTVEREDPIPIFAAFFPRPRDPSSGNEPVALLFFFFLLISAHEESSLSFASLFDLEKNDNLTSLIALLTERRLKILLPPLPVFRYR